jgi:hypothetical protein
MKTLLALVLPAVLAAQSTLLQVRLADEGTAFAPGTRTPGLTIEVTDELGRPVANAAVSLRLPFEGAGGMFANGLNTEVVTTGADGRATTSPVRWSREPGSAEVRITAVKGQLRAGTLATVKVGEGGPGLAARPAAGKMVRGKSHKKWIVVGLLAAGGAGAGIATATRKGGSGRSGSNPSQPGSSLTIGPPTITIGRP